MTTFTIKIDEELKKAAEALAKEFGISLASLIKMLLKNTVRSGQLDIDAKPRYHGKPEEGDLDFENPRDAVDYFKKLADEGGKIA